MKRPLGILLTALLFSALPGRAATITVPAGGLTGTVNWTANNEYLLDGWVYVLDGAVLNIEAGTVIRGKEAAAQPNYGALFICRGGKINAVGSPANPIIFTAESDDIADPFDIPLADEGGSGRGLWGGVIMLGKGRINRADAEASGAGTNPDGSAFQLYEGLGDSVVGGNNVHRFGGNDDTDNSGALRFVSIRYSGKVMESNKEINGLSMAGVGRSTTIEFVEVYANADDGFEWWGGAVNSRYLVSAFNSDECFDMDQGHLGKHQFWFGLQALSADEGLELNGQPSGGANVNTAGLQPFGRHEIYNVTLIGEGPGATSGSDVMNTRSEYYGSIHNSVFTQFQGRRVTESVANNYGYVAHNLFFDIYGAGASGDTYGDTNSPAALNPVADPLLRGISRAQDGQLDPRPGTGSPVFSGWRTPPVNSWFEPTAFKGAFDRELWCADWTALSDNQHLVNVSATTKCALPAAQPQVVINSSGTQATLTWQAVSGAQYQVQTSSDLVTWVNEGAAQLAGGEGTTTLTHASVLGGSGTDKHFRVIGR
ncbi:MAG: T9SS C-terminal target domain-containing protein [Verrucomicrobiales bacterium]|nr:T9SS C-terminal target domain-containing protein [Verrucomicrobiales bacterium]